MSIENSINALFEEQSPPVEFRPVSRETAGDLVASKLAYLKNQGTLTIQQVELAIAILPHCNIEDMLVFYAGYRGIITDTIYD